MVDTNPRKPKRTADIRKCCMRKGKSKRDIIR